MVILLTRKMVFVVNVGNATAINTVRFFYEETLNAISNCEVVVSGTDSVLRSEFDTEKVVKIFKDNVLVFQGEVHNTENFQSGNIRMMVRGDEIQLTEDKVPVVGSLKTRVWLATSQNTIFSALVTAAAGWSADVTGSSSTNIDFKVAKSQSIWEGVIQLIKHTNQDVEVDYSTKTLKLVDSRNRTNKAAFNENVNVGRVRFRKSKPRAKTVLVFGKGDGADQIQGSAGTGTPKLEIRDRNVFTTSEANNRATKELALIQNDIIHYSFNPYNPTEDVVLGDTVVLSASSLGLFQQSIDVVRITRGQQANVEQLKVEVTDQNHRIASRNLQEERAIVEAKNSIDATSMQGSGNLNTWAGQINAKTGASLKIIFNVGDSFEDEGGVLRIGSLTVDYDIDPFLQTAGSASFDGTDPQVQNSSANAIANVSGSVSLNDDFTQDDNASSAAGSAVSAGSFTDLVTFNNINGNFTLFTITFKPDSAGQQYWLRVKNNDTGDFYPDSAGQTLVSVGTNTMAWNIFIPDQIDIDDLIIQYKAEDGMDWYAMLQSFDQHLHTDGTLGADNHPHSNGAFDILATDIDNISIGDGVSEAGSVNASSVNLYLDFWNGSSWINKHSILATGATLDRDVDISSSGTYPDAKGMWRVRVEPITAAGDLAKGIVRINNPLDN